MTDCAAILPAPGILAGLRPERGHGARPRAAAGALGRTACANTLERIAGVAHARLGYAPHAGQRAAAMALLEGRMVEMDTGEGKTLAIALAAATAALAGTPVHVVTANDYLAARDACDLRGFYAALGLDVAAVASGDTRAARATAHAAHVTYATARELAFDYLRDGMAGPRPGADIEQRARRLAGRASAAPATLRRGLCMAIVDEADTVLIDEARVPLVLSRPRDEDPDRELYPALLALARTLAEGRDCRVDRHARRATLTDAGRARLAALPPPVGSPAGDARHREDLMRQALAALHCFERDRDYVVKDGAVVIVDETTGRDARARAWSRGLHQLIELKEGITPSPRGVVAAQITSQRFFRRYLHLCGISGTLAECAREMRAVYGVKTVRVEPRRPGMRRALPETLYASATEQIDAAVARIRAQAGAGRAVLAGTDSVAASARLSRALAGAGIDHAVLDARHDAHEAEIVRMAGQPGRVTVATSMAGRGTDIAVHPDVLARGGLHVILLQHNASPRIDRQFIGRAARRGEPGSCEILRSIDAPLMRRHLPRALAHAVLALSPRFPRLARLACAWPQWREESCQRAERLAFLRADEAAARLYAFGGEGP